MCGIIGFTEKNEQQIRQAIKKISHRGPDAVGFFINEQISLGHCRLSILDLSALANQPMISSDGNKILVYNGEIYNFQELRQDLIKKGYIFKTRGDSEVILCGYQDSGINFFNKLRGMWALAIYDRDNSQLVLSRDCFGIKPLYYAVNNSKLFFGSELKGLKGILPSININKDYYYQLFNLGFFCAPQTAWLEIKKMEPGEIIVWDFKRAEIKERIKLAPVEDDLIGGDDLSFDQSVELVDEVLSESVNAHYISDVPVGLLLSGGNDSSLIAALSIKNGKQPIAYHLAIKGSLDTQYAEKVSRHLGLELVKLEMTTQSLQAQYEKIWEFVDEPIAESSFIPTSLIYSAIAGRSKVVLSGEGGDELFGGYMRHNKLFRHNCLKRNNHFIGFINWLAKNTDWFSLKYANPALNRLRNFILDNYQNDLIGSYLVNMKIIDYPYHYSAIRKYLFDYYRQYRGELIKKRTNLFFDSELYLPNDLMYKNDLSSMVYSIEARVPFLDKKVFNAIYHKIKPEYCLSKDHQQKEILKKVLEKYLPKDLVYRPKKGFSFSFKKYYFEPFRQDYIKAAAWHLKNLDTFDLINSGLQKILEAEKTDLVINKYPSFAFAVVANWKIFNR